MIKRKLMQMSNSSFVVTIPKDWANVNSLNKGDSIEFENIGNDLIIKGKKEKNIELELDFTGMDYDLIWRHLVCAYRKGANELVIKYSSKENLNYVMQFVKDLMGWAIVKQDKDKIIIKDIIPIENTDLEETFKKVFLLVLDMSDEVLEGFSKQDKNILDNIPYSDYNINKFTNLCLRILNSRSDYNKNNSLYKIVSVLEEIGDEYRKLAVFYIPGKASKELLDMFKKVNDLLKFYYELFYDFHSNKLKKFYLDAEILLKDLKKFKRSNQTEMRTFVTLYSIYHMTKNLAEENLVLSL